MHVCKRTSDAHMQKRNKENMKSQGSMMPPKITSPTGIFFNQNKLEKFQRNQRGD